MVRINEFAQGLRLLSLLLCFDAAALCAFQVPATARITFRVDGTAHVVSATSDIGPGTYTVMTMIAAEYLGLRPEQVKFELGDTKFPRAPSQGGSKTTASVGSAVHGAALAVGARLLSLANREANSPLKTAAASDVEMLDGRLRLCKISPVKAGRTDEARILGGNAQLLRLH